MGIAIIKVTCMNMIHEIISSKVQPHVLYN